MFEFKSKKTKLAFYSLILFVAVGAVINYTSSLNQNDEKLPPELETGHKYTKWINKWKERFPQIESDTFKRVDGGEVISSTDPRYTFTTPIVEEVRLEVNKFKDDKFVVVAPDKLQYLGFRKATIENDARTSFVYYYGIRDNKLLTGAIYECKKNKCWYDRPFFEGPDLFYLPEIQEKIYKDDPERCKREKICAYELYLHEFDLKKNRRTTYRSTQLLTNFSKIEETINDL